MAMELWFNGLVLLVSLALLAKSSHIVLKSSIKLAKYFHIGEFAAGFILIAVATSLPELAVTVMAGAKGTGDIIVGNVFGSNIINILLVLGLGAVLGTIRVRQKTLVDNAEILLFITLIPVILLWKESIAFTGGMVLVLMFGLYAFFVVKQETSLKIVEHIRAYNKLKELIIFGLAMSLLLLSARFLVESAVEIASGLNVPNAIIGLTVVAFGTSMPELAIEINAVMKRKAALALGEILGSCVVNLSLILGVGAMLTELTIDTVVFQTSTFFLILSTVLLTYVLFKFKSIPKLYGLGFILVYVVFLFAEIGVISLF